MPESALSDVINLIYAAATGDGAAWDDVAPRLCTLFGAQRVSLVLLEAPDRIRQVLGGGDDEYADAYAEYYHRIDPYRRLAEQHFRDPGMPRINVIVGDEIVPYSALTKSDYYADYARPAGFRYLLGGLPGAESFAPIGFSRDATSGPFSDADKRRLLTLLPHLQRALQLEKRLAIADRTHLGSGALDALAIAVVLVDRTMRILYANAAACRLMEGSQCGLAMLGSGPCPGVGDVRLLARHPDDQSTLVKLVADATAGGSGGAFRLRTTRDEPARNAQLAVLVSPALTHLFSRQIDGYGVAPGAAMLVVRQLNRGWLPPPSLMSELYGLTKAEAEVALRFSGGATAEDVARHRQVSLDTGRTQVKTILRKTNAASLRDLERIIAISSAILPAAS
ncbi:PAS domain-containing protein [Paraburkholderia dilworthii]|uniref:PAS domain-containing protein n=1 Tax=Paraburkholderia dilworthii TaxID=948106 RepID=UPI001267A13E|nr:PAS domain-containing protein [Paraburkholderia dilworthii]